MNRDLLVRFAGFVAAHNDSGGYAVFETTKLSNQWYGVRKIVILGSEVLPRKPVEFHTASISHRLRQGRRYMKEFHNADIVGAGKTVDMVAHYHSGYQGMQPSTEQWIHPSSWIETGSTNDSGSRSWRVPCNRTTYQTLENGTIEAKVKGVWVSVERPLYGKIFALEERTSKTSCDKLVCTPSTFAEASTGIDTVLSILGAVLHDTNGKELKNNHKSNKYVRADNLKSILASLSNHSANGHVLSASLVDSGLTHSAGNKGTFPIYKLVPVLRIQNQWYNLNSLKPTKYIAANGTKVRYLEVFRDN